MAIAHVSDSTLVNASQVGTTAATAIAATVAGNALVLYTAAYINTATPIQLVSVSDTAGNKWTVVRGIQGVDGTTYTVGIDVAYCIGAASTTSITATYSAIPNNNCLLQASQFSGVPANACVDCNSCQSLAFVATSPLATPSVVPTCLTGIGITVTGVNNTWSGGSAPGTALLNTAANWDILSAPGSPYSSTYTGTSQNTMALQTVVIGVPRRSGIIAPSMQDVVNFTGASLGQAMARASQW